jgi:Phosphatidate cytidylyltransferase, mitochondrial
MRSYVTHVTVEVFPQNCLRRSLLLYVPRPRSSTLSSPMIRRLLPISHRAVPFVSLHRVCVRSISHRKEPIQFPAYNEKTYGADVKTFSQLPTNFGANQHISIDDALKEKLRSILWKFNAPIRYAFAYGSGVFQQANADDSNVAS